MKDKKQRTWLILQGIWVLVFLAAALLLQGRYRILAIICAAYTLVHGLIRARTEQKLAERTASWWGEEKNSPEDGEKP